MLFLRHPICQLSVTYKKSGKRCNKKLFIQIGCNVFGKRESAYESCAKKDM